MENWNFRDIEGKFEDYSIVYNNLVNETNFNDPEVASLQAVKIEIVRTYILFLDDLIKKRISFVDDETQKKISKYEDEIQYFGKNNFNYEESVHYDFFKLILETDKFYLFLIGDLLKEIYSIFESIKNEDKTIFEKKDELLNILKIFEFKLTNLEKLVNIIINDKIIQYDEVRISDFHRFLKDYVDKDILEFSKFENFFGLFVRNKYYNLGVFIRKLRNIYENLRNDKGDFENFKKEIILFIDEILLVFLKLFDSLNQRIGSDKIKDYFNNLETKKVFNGNKNLNYENRILPKDFPSEEETIIKKEGLLKKLRPRWFIKKEIDYSSINWNKVNEEYSNLINSINAILKKHFYLDKNKEDFIKSFDSFLSIFEGTDLYNEVEKIIFKLKNNKIKFNEKNLKKIFANIESFIEKYKNYFS